MSDRTWTLADLVVEVKDDDGSTAYLMPVTIGQVAAAVNEEGLANQRMEDEDSNVLRDPYTTEFYQRQNAYGYTNTMLPMRQRIRDAQLLLDWMVNGTVPEELSEVSDEG